MSTDQYKLMITELQLLYIIDCCKGDAPLFRYWARQRGLLSSKLWERIGVVDGLKAKCQMLLAQIHSDMPPESGHWMKLPRYDKEKSAEIGDSLRQERLKMGLTLKAMTEVLNITYQALSSYELGRTRIPVGYDDEIKEVMAILGQEDD